MERIKLEKYSCIASISGRTGNMVFRTTADGNIYMQQATARTKRPGTPAQQQWCRGTFKEAIAYGNAQKRDPVGTAYYERFRKSGSFDSVYDLALADYARPPEVRAIETTDYDGRAGEWLRVQTHDPYGVVAVRIYVLDADGQVLEEEDATAAAEAEWREYLTQQAHARGRVQQVRALAFDRPGNSAAGIKALKAN